MSTATLRTVGGSVVVAIPKRLLELVHLQVGSQVSMDVQHGKLVVAPIPKKRYTLAELLAQCDASVAISPQEREWIDTLAVGLEASEMSH